MTASIRWECTLPALRDVSLVRLLNCNTVALHRLLRTSPHLTSLIITGTGSTDRKGTPLETVFEAFKAAPDALPQLTSFKLLASPDDVGLTGAHEQVLAAFLNNKTQLRRLHVNLSWGHRSFPCPHILEVLPSLPHLKVLGVQLSCDTLDADELRSYDLHLPRDLTTLLVTARFGQIDISPGELLSLVRARQWLRCRCILNPFYAVYLPDQAEDVDAGSRHSTYLQSVGRRAQPVVVRQPAAVPRLLGVGPLRGGASPGSKPDARRLLFRTGEAQCILSFIAWWPTICSQALTQRVRLGRLGVAPRVRRDKRAFS